MAGAQKAVCLVRSSVNIDEVLSVAHIVRPGETLSSTGVDRKIGGKGANVSAAIGLAKAGEAQQVLLAGSIGQDEWLLEELRQRNVRTDCVLKRDDARTGTAYIQVAEDGENSIILLKGANFAPSQQLDDPSTCLSQASAAAGSPVTHLVLQNEIPLSVTISLARHAAKQSSPPCITIFNPSPMLLSDELRSFPWAVLDVLIVNEGEGRDLLEALQQKAPAHEVQGSEIVRALGEVEQLSQIPWLVMTRGGQGVSASILCSSSSPPTTTAGSSNSVERHLVSVPAGKPRQVKDTTGAGDTFAGYLVASLMLLDGSHVRGGQLDVEPIEQTLQLAALAGAIAVETPGAMVSIPSRQTVLSRREA